MCHSFGRHVSTGAADKFKVYLMLQRLKICTFSLCKIELTNQSTPAVLFNFFALSPFQFFLAHTLFCKIHFPCLVGGVIQHHFWLHWVQEQLDLIETFLWAAIVWSSVCFHTVWCGRHAVASSLSLLFVCLETRESRVSSVSLQHRPQNRPRFPPQHRAGADWWHPKHAAQRWLMMTRRSGGGFQWQMMTRLSGHEEAVATDEVISDFQAGAPSFVMIQLDEW